MGKTVPDYVDYHTHLAEAGAGLRHMEKVLEAIQSRKEWNKEDGFPSKLLQWLQMADDLLMNRKTAEDAWNEFKNPISEQTPNFNNLERVYGRILLISDAVITQIEQAMHTKKYPGATYAEKLATSPLNVSNDLNIQHSETPDSMAARLVLGVRNCIAYMHARRTETSDISERRSNAVGPMALGYEIADGQVITKSGKPFVFDAQDLDLDKIWNGNLQEGITA